tara:strand:+ start:1851 stop:2174 length:324 start_codon:yes stop_codon:yes gene_type:complete
MEVTGMQIGFDALVSLISALIGALTVWYSLKNKVAIQQVILENLTSDMEELKSDKKEAQNQLHKRINDLKSQVESNREKNDASLSDLKIEMREMELRIIQAIQTLKK